MDSEMELLSAEERMELLADKFKTCGRWEDGLRLIISAGKQLPPFPQELKVESNLLAGCLSRIWITSHFNSAENKLLFQGEAEAAMMKGFLAIYLSLYSGLNPQEILKIPQNFLEKIGLGKHLSSNRRSGLSHMEFFFRNAPLT